MFTSFHELKKSYFVLQRNKSTFYVSLKRDSYLLAQDNPLMIGDLNINDSTTIEKTSFEIKVWRNHELINNETLDFTLL